MAAEATGDPEEGDQSGCCRLRLGDGQRYPQVVMIDDSHAKAIADRAARAQRRRWAASNASTSSPRPWARRSVAPASLFSNSLSPPIVSAGLKALKLITTSSNLRDRLHVNAQTLRVGLEKAGFKLKSGSHPILPVMLGDAALVTKIAGALLQRGIYVIGF